MRFFNKNKKPSDAETYETIALVWQERWFDLSEEYDRVIKVINRWNHGYDDLSPQTQQFLDELEEAFIGG